MKGIILTAGAVDSSLVPLFGEIPTGLVPVNGRPVLFLVIDGLLKIGVEDLYFAVDIQSEYIESMVRRYMRGRANPRFVKGDRHAGPGDSLLAVFREIGTGPAIVNLADSVVRFPWNFCQEQDGVVFSRSAGGPERWCAIDVDTRGEKPLVTSLRDKDGITSGSVLTGVYFFSDVGRYAHFTPTRPRTEISELLQSSMDSGALVAQEAEEWLDFGHVDQYQSSRKRMLGTRYFNSLEFDDVLGTVTKRSKDVVKFAEEIRWQINLPAKLKIFFPRITDYAIFTRDPFVTMEYYGYQSVAEIWLYSSNGEISFPSIIRRLLNVLDLFRDFATPVPAEAYREMYERKTMERLNSLTSEDLWFEELFEHPVVYINNKAYRNWRQIRASVMDELAKLYDERFNCLIHGDFCFSNILYDVNGGVVRLIDPRGSWGKGIGGDVRYDVAKLRHSACGFYDFIVNDLFVLEHHGCSINYELFTQAHHIELGDTFDRLIVQKGYDLDQIKLIEGILFMSMLPLHKGDRHRQAMMYCRGIELLNTVVLQKGTASAPVLPRIAPAESA